MTYTKQQWANEETVGHAAAINAPYGPMNAARLGVMEQGISDAQPRFTLTSDGTTVTGSNAAGGLIASGVDGGAVMTAILAAIPAAGGMIEFRNDGNAFPWVTQPLFPKSITRKLLVLGNGVTLVTTGVPGFGFNRTADYDTFQNIEVRDFVFDATSKTVSAFTHVFLGTISGGAVLQRVNLDRITVRGITIINMPAQGAGQTVGIEISSRHLAAGEGTQTNLTNILVEDIDMATGTYGPDCGVRVIGTGGSSGVEVFYDNVIVQRVNWRPTAAVAATFRAQSGIHIGSRGFGGTCTVRDNVLSNSADVGIEIDGHTKALYDNNEVTDSFSVNLFIHNFHAPQYPLAKVTTFRDNKSRVIGLNPTEAGASCTGFGLYQPGSVSTGGHVVFEGANVHHSRQTNGRVSYAIDAIYQLDSLSVHGFEGVWDSINETTALARALIAMRIQPTTTGSTVRIRDVYLRYAGSTSNSNFNLQPLDISGNSSTVTVDIDGVYIDNAITGLSAGRSYNVLLGRAAGTVQGVVRRIRPLNWASDTTPIGLYVFGTGTLTIGTGLLRIEGCDWSALPVGAQGGGFTFAATSNIASCRLRGNSWRVYPVPGSLTGLVTATGKALTTGWDALVTFAQGSGAAITAIDYSTNGGTTYTNYLTQASAALPGGFDQTLGPLPSDALIKVTWAATTTATGVNALNSATVNVGSTTGYPTAGTFLLVGVPVTYTGTTGTSFTGCGNHAATTGGEAVTAPQPTINLVPANP